MDKRVDREDKSLSIGKRNKGAYDMGSWFQRLSNLAYGVFLMHWGTTGLYASDYIEFPFQSGRN